MRYTIEIKNEEDVAFIKELLTKLHIEIRDENVHNQKDQKKAFEALEELARRNTYAKDIEDPVAWQREIRKDRKLPFRED
jgi:hypothetical protein